jgi:spermidine synthase
LPFLGQAECEERFNSAKIALVLALLFAATIFLSAFLLFQVQPLIAKFILPWFGGSASVWSAVLLFFQLLLVVGYLYAHCLIRFLKPRRQLWLHATLLVASLLALPIIPSAFWKPDVAGDPTLRILLLLTVTVGLPYTLLSATSPLLQAWYLRANAESVPYRLFSLSNLGSMLALLSYPFLVEPSLRLGTQARIWSVAYAAFTALCAVTGWRSRGSVSLSPRLSEDITAPAPGAQLFWIALPACASTLLLAVTSQLTQNVAPIPLLWVAPLALYLLSFILCFGDDRIYSRIIFLPLLAGSLGFFAYSVYIYENNISVKKLIPALCGALFVCCMVCHGELARRKPHPRFLTQFYLMVSVGGALGGLFVALAAPHLFKDYLELPIAVSGCAALVTCVLWNRAPGEPRALWIRIALVIATCGLAGYLGFNEAKKARGYVVSARNFYGTLRVRDDAATEEQPAQRVLMHGTISHGTQLTGPGSGRIATSYYGHASGVSRAIRALGETGPVRIGVIGLGAGVIAALARAGDTIHYYEINPLVVHIANNQFGFLSACPAEKQIFLGDGRLLLERLAGEQLDVLAVDAFNSDSIPVHLLTKEAFQMYQRHLKPGGVIAVDVANRYLDLKPVIAQAASEMGWSGVMVEDDGNEEDYYASSTWVLVGRSGAIFDKADFRDPNTKPLVTRPGFRGWTDDYSNMFQILK